MVLTSYVGDVSRTYGRFILRLFNTWLFNFFSVT